MLKGVLSSAAVPPVLPLRRSAQGTEPCVIRATLHLLMSAGQVHDCTGALALQRELPDADWRIAGRGHDADWFRYAQENKEIEPCITGRRQRKAPVKYDKQRYNRRNCTKITFGRLKDWRRIATRYDRCPKVFLSAVALAVTSCSGRDDQ